MSVKKFFLIVVALGTAFTNSAAFAQSNSANFNGLDEIKAQCIVSTKRKYARKICERLSNAAMLLADDSGIEYAYSGVSENFKPEKEANSKQTLQLLFYIRGTRGRNVGTSVRIVAGVRFAAAIEKPIDGKTTQQTPRSGLLVLWEKSVVAEGPSKKMINGISPHMIKKMDGLFKLIAARK